MEWRHYLQAAQGVAHSRQWELYIQLVTNGQDSASYKETQQLQSFYLARVAMAQENLKRWKRLERFV